MNNIPIAVFAYSFNHRKTTDFLNILYKKGFINVSVVAAPKLDLESGEEVLCADNGTERICSEYRFNYIKLAHDNVDGIKKFLSEAKCKSIAIISGARILKKNIIDIFEKGVINFHPGLIPATSGLDSFYWMIKRNVKPGVTAHFIDHKVDAGRILSFYDTEININDDEGGVKEKIYKTQIDALKSVLEKIKDGSEVISAPIDRPFKNSSLCIIEKEKVMLDFHNWKTKVVNFEI
ncbi:formyltransferase family protein [Endozoicomonas sp. Mp262]|uniref:formyltransferase family protein n=1 Tax=Endozoicomonas sp. Mp262 TaxID=2919499 RepID=UPI0021DB0562